MKASIIVPVRWSGPEHARLFVALAGQQLAEPFEVIAVVLDGGRGRDSGGDYPADWPAAVKVIRADPSTPGTARNDGAKIATGEFLLFIDDDCFPPPDWAARLLAGFEPGTSVVAGGLTAAPTPSLVGRYLGAYALPLDREPALFRTVEPFISFGHTANLAVRRADFEKLGGFDPKLRTAEDHDLCYRLIAQCGALRRLPEVTVEHRHRTGFFAMLHQAVGFGMGQAFMMFRYCRGSLILELPGRPLRRIPFFITIWCEPLTLRLKLLLLLLLCLIRWWFGLFLLAWLWRLGGQVSRRLQSEGLSATFKERLGLALLHVARDFALSGGFFAGDTRYRFGTR